MKKYIIGLGCSWTQGEGGYPDQVWQDHGGRVQVRGRSDHYLRQIEHENSWVNVLCRDHFPEYEPMNLGVRGIGNRAAVGQLHFCDKIDWNNSIQSSDLELIQNHRNQAESQCVYLLR
jgi:hypothetical protein